MMIDRYGKNVATPVRAEKEEERERRKEREGGREGCCLDCQHFTISAQLSFDAWSGILSEGLRSEPSSRQRSSCTHQKILIQLMNTHPYSLPLIITPSLPPSH